MIIDKLRIDKIMEFRLKMGIELSFNETMKLFREILYRKYEELEDSDAIHCYQLTRDMIDIFTQMVNGRKFEESYLKDKIKW